MNASAPQSPWKRYLLYFLVGSLLFAGGWFARNRTLLSQSPDTVTVVGANGAMQNALSNMQIIDIIGVAELDGANTQYRQFGQLYYFEQPDNSTEVHIRIGGVPETITNKDEKGPTRGIPRNLDIQLALLTFGGEDYDYETIGQIKLSPDEDNILRGEYSTVLPPATGYDGNPIPVLREVQRVVFNSENEEYQNIFSDANDDLPIKVRQRPAPFFWAVVERT